MESKALSAKIKQHDIIVAAIFEVAATYTWYMKSKTWLYVIKTEVYERAGFYPTIDQVRYALRKLARLDMMFEAYHEGGWYRYYTYKPNPNRMPF